MREAAILHTAWELLAVKSMMVITVDELATGAGISRSAFYFYFDSREAVFRTLAMRTITELRSTALGDIDRSQPARENIGRRVRGLLSRWETNGPFIRAMGAFAEHDADLRQFWQSVNDEINAVVAAELERARAAGLALPAPPSALDLVTALAAMIWRSGYEMSLLPEEEREFERLAVVLTEASLRVLGIAD